MILWSSKELERALAGGELDSWTKVKYVMLTNSIRRFGRLLKAQESAGS